MSFVFYILLTLIFASIALSVIFYISWRTIDKQPYALIWSVTFGISAIQRTANIFAEQISQTFSYTSYWMLVCILSLLTATLGLWGHVLRTKTKFPMGSTALAGFIVAFVTFYFTAISPHRGLQTSIYIFHNAVLLAAVAVILGTYRPNISAAEKGAVVTYSILAIGQFIAALLLILQGEGRDELLVYWYRVINFTMLPSAFIAMGMFVVFVLASDMSEKMRQLAMTDSLTDCLNRRGFYELANQKITKEVARQNHTCLVYFDIDKFKVINDTYGHDGGDETLKATANWVRQNIKRDDLFGRLGGEEFVVLLSRIERDDALAVADRLRRLIETSFVEFQDHKITFTLSIGVVEFTPQPHMSVEQLINEADKLLYQAKEGGRNQVVYA